MQEREIADLKAQLAAMTAERDRLLGFLKKIAKPALGGKQQQYMAQAVLRGEGG